MGARDSRLRIIVAACAGLVLWWGSEPAQAVGFVEQPGGFDEVLRFDKSYAYFWAGAAGVNPLSVGINWNRTLTDAAAAGGARNLTVDIQHLVPAGPMFHFDFPGLVHVAAALPWHAQAAQRAHGDREKDIASVVVAVALPGAVPDAFVQTKGRHITGFAPFGWSLHNPETAPGPLVAVAVTPSYRQAGTDVGDPPIIFDGPPVAPAPGPIASGATGRGGLPATAVNPANGRIGRLADYRVTATGSGPTETTLAFVGEVDGVLSEIDIDAGLALFAPSGRFVAPMFTHADGVSPLFVAIDLVQWLSALSLDVIEMPDLFGRFSITGGTHAALPGFMFSTAPIGFVSGVGWTTTGAAFNGDVVVRAIIDGETPEPGTVALLAAALVAAMRVRRRSTAASTQPTVPASPSSNFRLRAFKSPPAT